jgi:GAF domain-containing protein
MDQYEYAVEQALQMMNAGSPRKEILSFLTTAAEAVAGPDTVSSILLLDGNGLLRNGASPRLPSDYLKAIDGLKPDPGVGTCAAAAATGSMVVTEDFYADNKWAELRHLPMALGFKGAWSMPIITADGKVLGTFGTYFSKKRLPSENEIDGVQRLAHAAAMVLTQNIK